MALLARLQELEKKLVDANVGEDVKELAADVLANARRVKDEVLSMGAAAGEAGAGALADAHGRLHDLLHGKETPPAAEGEAPKTE